MSDQSLTVASEVAKLASRVKALEERPGHKHNASAMAMIKSISLFQNLPGLRGFWSFGNFDENGYVYDLSTQGRVLTYGGAPDFRFSGLIPYVYVGGSGYFTRADEAGFDIIGNESIVPNMAGLTMGMWIKPYDLTGTSYGLMGKCQSGTSSQNVYSLWNYRSASPSHCIPVFDVSTDGTTRKNVDGTSSEWTDLNWKFVVGRWTPSTELAIWSNGVKNTNTSSIPATLANTTAPFGIGRSMNIGSGTYLYWKGFISRAFLCHSALSDEIIDVLFDETRELYGV